MLLTARFELTRELPSPGREGGRPRCMPDADRKNGIEEPEQMFRYSTKTSHVYVLLLTAGLAGCSKDLSRSRAADLIKQHQEFAVAMEVKVPVGNIWWDWRNVDDSNPTYPLKTLKDRDIITIRESGQKEGYWNKEFLTELTAHGKDLSKSWIQTKEAMPNAGTFMGPRCWTTFGHGEPCHESKGVVYSVVLARRKIDEVTGITVDPGGKESAAEFNWEWMPTDDGKLFPGRVPPGVQKGQAAFQLYDDGWRLAQIALN